MPKFDLYKIITIVLIVAIGVTLVFFVLNLYRGKVGKAALSVDTVYEKAAVLISNKDKGQTPVYTEDVYVGDLQVEINGSKNSYSTSIKPAAGTLAAIKRDLGVNEAFSSGQNIWFEKIGGEDPYISVISPQVNEVTVTVDGVEVGKTPVKVSTKDLLNVNEENRYKVGFKKTGYEDQEVDVKVRPGYELTIRVDMFLSPVPTEVTTLSGLPEGVQFINLSKVDNPAFSDKQAWAKAMNYWLATRGEGTFGNFKVSKFSYFVADDGKIYNADGNEITPTDMKLEAGMFVGYLGSNQNPDITQAAQDSLAKALGKAPVITSTTPGKEGEAGTGQQIKINQTELGFLRVRSAPSTSAQQVGQADSGKTFTALEEKNQWYKIEYVAGQQGWVSGVYVTKVTPEKPAQ